MKERTDATRRVSEPLTVAEANDKSHLGMLHVDAVKGRP